MFVSFWQNFVKSAKQKEILPHISIYICIYMFVCKILQNYFCKLTILFWQNLCGNFGKISLGFVISFATSFWQNFFSAKIVPFRGNPTYIFSSHVREGPVQKLGPRMLIG
jgi:hypothetical protein